jgi:hypothetical protein
MGKKENKKEDDSIAGYVKSGLATAIQQVPILGQIFSATQYKNSPIPLEKFMVNLFSDLNYIFTAKKMDTKARHILKFMSGSFGVAMGLPTDQAEKLLEQLLFNKESNSRL